MGLVNQNIATGQHYKSYHIKPSDISKYMTVSWLQECLQLDDYTTSLVSMILGRVKYSTSSSDPFTCKQVKPEYEGLALDPFFIAEHIGFLGLAEGTILKKILRMGKGDKSVDQDMADIIGACQAAILLFPFKASVYLHIISQIEQKRAA